MTAAKKIVMVDDDRDYLSLMKVMLSKNGYEVHFALDGFSALRTIQKEQPDLILLDLGLPAGDGFTVMKRLKSLVPVCDIPVITVSGRDPDENRQKAMESGARAYIQKPCETEDLLAAIHDVLHDAGDEAGRHADPNVIRDASHDSSRSGLDAGREEGGPHAGDDSGHAAARRDAGQEGGHDAGHETAHEVGFDLGHAGGSRAAAGEDAGASVGVAVSGGETSEAASEPPTLNGEYVAPPTILDPVRRYFKFMGFDDGIELDPVTTANNPTDATNYCICPKDALNTPWSLHDDRPTCVFFKPPFLPEIDLWLGKLDKESTAGNHIVALLPATSLETEAWQRHVFNERLTAMCLVRGPIPFAHVDTTETVSKACILYVYNGKWSRVAECFGDLGLCFPILEMAGRPH